VIIWEAHLLHLTMHVVFARWRIWVAKWDHCVVQLPLLPTVLYIHVIDIEGVFCKALMCRGPIKDKDPNTIWMSVLKDLKCMLDLFNQLGEILPCIEALSGVGNLLGFKRGKVKLSWLCKLLGDLFF